MDNRKLKIPFANVKADGFPVIYLVNVLQVSLLKSYGNGQIVKIKKKLAKRNTEINTRTFGEAKPILSQIRIETCRIVNSSTCIRSVKSTRHWR